MLKSLKSLIVPTIVSDFLFFGGILLCALWLTKTDFTVSHYRYLVLLCACFSATVSAILFGQKENAKYAIIPLALFMLLPLFVFRSYSLFLPLTILIVLLLYYAIVFLKQLAKTKKKTNLQKLRRNYERAHKK